ncbi:MAG: PDZ domain-containing protein, partial [Pseudomonadota bacterium]|nr:PDZ domain-containing protein [Pseudomonadota bacterium]
GLISNRPTAGEAESFADLGFDVRPLTEELATQYGLEPEENTVVITSVAENSPASRKGLEEGLIIRRLNQTAITSVEQLNEGISAARDEDRKGILMLIEDAEGRSRFVQVSFE